jgi:hypothetical protein
MAHENLGAAKKKKNDEFYTQYRDIEKEMNAYLDFDKDVFRDKTVLLPCDDPEWSNFTKYFAQNFERLGLKKLISTSYAPDSKPSELNLQLTLFETQSPKFDKAKARANGKIYTLTRDTTGDQKINVEDLEWEYLQGDGDFRSAEITTLRDEADIIITNPPFSLFREFLAWIVEAGKQFSIIGNMNAITYKETFPLIKDGQIWLGNNARVNGGAMFYEIPESIANLDQVREVITDETGRKRYITRVQGVRWFTNIEHGIRHTKLTLMSEIENVRFSKHKEVKDKGYQKYDNYDAIEVPYVNAIPGDCTGAMGVPISILDKYNPDQFQILGMCENEDLYRLKTKQYTSAECKAAYLAKFKKPGTYDMNASGVLIQNGQYEKVYQRIIIKHKKSV